MHNFKKFLLDSSFDNNSTQFLYLGFWSCKTIWAKHRFNVENFSQAKVEHNYLFRAKIQFGELIFKKDLAGKFDLSEN